MSTRTAVPLIYVADYSPVASQAGGGMSAPEWSSDSYQTPGAAIGKTTFIGYAAPPGAVAGGLFYGDNLGRIYEEDENVAYTGYAIVATGAHHFGDVGGGVDEGKQLERLWSYVVSEDSDWLIRVWGGDEIAYAPDGSLNQPFGGTPQGFSNYALPGIIDEIAASRMEAAGTYEGYERRIRHQPKSVHQHIVDGKTRTGGRSTGRCFTFELIFFDPKAAIFLGLGGVIGPGTTPRPVYTVESVE